MTRGNQAVQRSASPAETNLEGHQWPDEVRFTPYWGDLYWGGTGGRRVLLLGESHYRREGAKDSLEVTRPFTQDHFREMALPVRNGRDGPFFKALDLILTGRQDFRLQDAAEAWRRVAFLNLSQAFAGSQANHRPRNQALRDGGAYWFETFCRCFGRMWCWCSVAPLGGSLVMVNRDRAWSPSSPSR